MAKIDVYNMDGTVNGQIELSDAVFGIEPNEAVMHQVVKSQLANLRQGTSKTKGRSEVRGGGRKPYRQKGTGRARQGSIRAAQWVGGGIIFGPVPRSYRQAVPKKLRRLALKSALSQKLLEGNVIVLDKLELDEIKTKKFVAVLKNLKIDAAKALVVTDESNTNVERSARNLINVQTARVNTLNVLNILKYDKFVVTKAAVEQIEEVYAS
ncbi:50S ribosomal protein L4 [Oscillospiraceae bacterium HV4-5-C5C]|nr:50S ribosomal protein L4 [Oscillospiraceae bacterium HV4-5-C5C]